MDYIHFLALITLVSVFALILLYKYNETKKHVKKIKLDFKIIDKYVLFSHSNLDGKIVDVSQALCDLSGYSKDELIGKPCDILRDPSIKVETLENLSQTIQQGKQWRGEIQNIKKDSTSYWVDILISPTFTDAGDLEGYTTTREDITDKKRIEKLIITDQLTQLYNRLFLDRTYTYEVHRSLRFGSRFSVVLLDIDNFKDVNVTYGHDVGDKVLIEIGSLLQNSIRKTDIIGRWTGEEFLIFCHKSSLDQSLQLAKKLRTIVSEHEFSYVGKLTCSIGVSEYKSHDTEKEIIKRADIALNRAKNKGKNCVKVED